MDYDHYRMSSISKQEFPCTRYFATGFNVTNINVDSLECNFKELDISYMAVAVKNVNASGNFYFNFASRVRKNRIEELFSKLNVKGFTIDTFENDGGIGASDAVKSILEKKGKTGHYVREYGDQPWDIRRRLTKNHEKSADDMLSEEEINEKTFRALSQSIEQCDSRVGDVQKEMEGVKTNISEMNHNLKLDLESKDAIIAKLSKELEERNQELSERNKELSDRKISQRITFEKLEQAESECSRLRYENSRLYAEMSSTNHLAMIRNDLRVFQDLQDRRFRAMTLQSNMRFRILCETLGLRSQDTESMDI